VQVDNNKIPKPDRTTSIRKLLKSFVSQNVSTELKEDTQTEMKSVFVIKSAFKTPFRNLDDKAYQEDMLKIDKKVANEAFKNNKRTLDDYLRGKGFFKYKTRSYVRLNKIRVLECIELQKELYGTKTFTVNIIWMPLYVHHDYMARNITYRLGTIICGHDVWWDYANDSVAHDSFLNVLDAIDQFVIPRFEEYADIEKLKEYINNLKSLSVNNREWLKEIDLYDCNDDIVCENIDKFKLPKRLMNNLK